MVKSQGKWMCPKEFVFCTDKHRKSLVFATWIESIEIPGFIGFHMGFTWVSHGFHMGFTWVSRGFHMGFTCSLMIPSDFPWRARYGRPTAAPGNSWKRSGPSPSSLDGAAQGADEYTSFICMCIYIYMIILYIIWYIYNMISRWFHVEFVLEFLRLMDTYIYMYMILDRQILWHVSHYVYIYITYIYIW